MIVDHVVTGMFMENCYLVACEETHEGVIIDPGDEAERIIEMVTRHHVTPTRVINTHAHIDHVGAVADLCRHYGIPFAVHEGERDNLAALASHAAVFGLPAPEQPEVSDWIEAGQVFTFGHASLTTIPTPGHTPGGVSFHGDGFVIAGDTLFQRSIGRTDLPGGDFQTLRKSIREGLFALPPDTVVHCGHGPSTTIGQEKAMNPFVGDGANPALFGF
jgi:glyoxylase-like metal-dependent hydrolase (beta-lactamase superfamily II)